jgi:UrcA family protein
MKTLYRTAALALGLGLIGAGAAQAGGPAPKKTQVVVSYADLNISSKAGAEVLLFRLRVAASKSCGGVPQIGDLHAQANYDVCFKQALDDAVAHVASPTLAELYGKPMSQIAGR